MKDDAMLRYYLLKNKETFGYAEWRYISDDVKDTLRNSLDYAGFALVISLKRFVHTLKRFSRILKMTCESIRIFNKTIRKYKGN